MRVLLVADGTMLAAVGGLSAAFVARPAGLAFAAGAWVAAGLLLAGVPLTDPYRYERRRRRVSGASRTSNRGRR